MALKVFAFHNSEYLSFDLSFIVTVNGVCAVYLSFKERDSNFACTAFPVSIIHSHTVLVKCIENTIMNGFKFHILEIILVGTTHNFQYITIIFTCIIYICVCKARSTLYYISHPIKSNKFRKKKKGKL